MFSRSMIREFQCVDWEGVVENVVDDVLFLPVFILLQVIGVQSIVLELDCCVFMLCGVVGYVRDNGVSKCRFSVDEDFPVIGGSVDGNVQIV